MYEEIDFEKLRNDLLDYYGTFMVNLFPAAVFELGRIDKANNEELLTITKRCISNDLPSIHFGVIGTSDTFITSSLVDGIQKKFNNEIVCSEMEGCAVAHICTKLNIRNLDNLDFNNLSILNKISVEEYNFLKQIGLE